MQLCLHSWAKYHPADAKDTGLAQQQVLHIKAYKRASSCVAVPQVASAEAFSKDADFTQLPHLGKFKLRLRLPCVQYDNTCVGYRPPCWSPVSCTYRREVMPGSAAEH